MTLSENEIRRRLSPQSSTYGKDRLIVTPLIDPEDQISSSGIDLRLGTQFIVFKTHLHGTFNPGTIKAPEIIKYQEEIIFGMKQRIVLHPGQFILGSTLEYVGLPGDIEARMDGRSSWARLGLLIATATTIHPHFQGVVTLELTNHGSIPVELFPGIKIAFMTFKQLNPPVQRRDTDTKYDNAIGPGFTRIYKDKYIADLSPINT